MRPWHSHNLNAHERLRVLLDTNVWRYVVDTGTTGALLRAARGGALDVQISPAVVYETLRLKDSGLRQTLVRLMTDRRFVRLMPEAFSESMEILSEIERTHPEWLRRKPNLIFFDRLYKDWRKTSGGFWVRCARSPQAEYARLVAMGDDTVIAAGRAQAENARREVRGFGWKRNPPMDGSMAAFDSPRAGWRGDWFEAWRMDAYEGMSYALRRTGNAYRDWIAPFVELDTGLIASPQWLSFWVYEADKVRVPRQWIRWAHAFSQRFRKVTPGTPADTQLASYFLETDVVVSGDKALLDTLEECRSYAPCVLPRGEPIRAGEPGAQRLLSLLSGVS